MYFSALGITALSDLEAVCTFVLTAHLFLKNAEPTEATT